jgi:hypothetical protein
MAIIRQEDYDRFFKKPPPKPKRSIDFSQHRDMCQRAAKWLRGTMGCNVAVWEITACANEKPDAIGWNPYKSTLVECKMSRSDFLRDKLKYHKKTPESGMGNYRYYMCPPGIIKIDELPTNWGLLYLKNGRVSIIKKADRQAANLHAERAFLASILRRSLQGCSYLKAKIIDPVKPI